MSAGDAAAEPHVRAEDTAEVALLDPAAVVLEVDHEHAARRDREMAMLSRLLGMRESWITTRRSPVS